MRNSSDRPYIRWSDLVTACQARMDAFGHTPSSISAAIGDENGKRIVSRQTVSRLVAGKPIGSHHLAEIMRVLLLEVCGR